MNCAHCIYCSSSPPIMEDEMSFEIKQWANETLMQSLGVEGFIEQKEFYGVE